jgi:gliding motility-associated-like protein
MKFIIFTIFTFLITFVSFSQADCNIADYGCTLNDFTVNSSGGGAINDLPPGSNISNPTINPGTAGNSGCLFSNELNPTWIIFTISSAGFFEFTLGQAGGNGFFDWSLWPYYTSGDAQSITGADACAEIQGNQLAPVACNWNGSSAGYTGMVQQGNLPPGANQTNFEHSFWAEPGDQFVLMFSNFSGLIGTAVPIYTGQDIPGNSNNQQTAAVTCDPTSVGSTICLGETATISVDAGGVIGATFTFLNGQGDLVDPNQTGPSFDVAPTDTTTYFIEVSNGILTDTVEVTVNVVPPPVPNAGADFVVCFGSAGQLNGSVSDLANNYSWSFTGPAGTPAPPNVIYGPNNNSLTPTIQVNYAGQYVFTLTESNGVCPDEIDQVLVTFDVANIATAGTNPICAGATDGVIEITSANAEQYSFDNGATWQAGNSSTGFSSGTYAVCVQTALGCTACQNVTLQDGPGVSISVSNDTTICQNGTASLLALATGGSVFSYNWNHTASTSSSQSVNPIAATTYTVQAENEFGCLSPQQEIDVTVLPGLTGFNSPDQSICPGFSTLLSTEASNGNGGPYNYLWTDESGNTVSNTQTLLASPNQTATYTVTITDNCESTPVVLTTLVNLFPLPDVQFSVDDPAKCVPAVFTFSNDTDPTLTDNFYWYFSNGETVMNMTDFEVEFNAAGQYDVQLVVVSPDGCIDSLTRSNFLTVYPKPKANFTYSPNKVTVLNTSVFFQNYSQGATAYDWYFEQGNPSFSWEDNPTSLFPEGEVAEYQVELIVTSQFGCKDTAEAFIPVVPEVILYAPNSFTPDGDEYNNSWRVFISGISMDNFELEIYNRWGEMIWESHDPDASWDGIYGGNLVKEGTYIWRMRAMDMFTDEKFEWNGHVNVLY